MAQTDKFRVHREGVKERPLGKEIPAAVQLILNRMKTMEKERMRELRVFDRRTWEDATKLFGEGKYAEAEALVRSAIRDQKEMGESPSGPPLHVFETMLIGVLAAQGKIEEAEETLEKLGKRKHAVMLIHLIGAYCMRPRAEYAARARLLFDEMLEKYDALVEARRQGLVKPLSEAQVKNEMQIMADLCVVMEKLYGRVVNAQGQNYVHEISKQHGWTEG